MKFSLESGHRGREGISTEGATGWDELRYVPFAGDRDPSSMSMTEKAEQINKILDEIGPIEDTSVELTPSEQEEALAYLRKMAEEERKNQKDEYLKNIFG